MTYLVRQIENEMVKSHIKSDHNNFMRKILHTHRQTCLIHNSTATNEHYFTT